MLLLASASPTRAAMLARAGLACRAEPARVDEAAVREAMRAEGAGPRDTAMALAELKAGRLSNRYPELFVIGADQILSCGTAWFDKPADLDHARAHLLALRGKTHVLHTAVCVARGGSVLWRHVEEPALSMRAFSDSLLDGYLERQGEAVLGSVGAYRIEECGAQLFDKVEGDWFAILGLPLLPLLAFLRLHRQVPE